MSYLIYILHPAEDSRVLVMGSGAVCQGVYRYKDKAPDPVPCSGWDFLVPRLWCHMPVPPTTASFYSLKVSCPRRGHSQEGRFPYWHKGVRGVLPVPPTTGYDNSPLDSVSPLEILLSSISDSSIFWIFGQTSNSKWKNPNKKKLYLLVFGTRFSELKSDFDEI